MSSNLIFIGAGWLIVGWVVVEMFIKKYLLWSWVIGSIVFITYVGSFHHHLYTLLAAAFFTMMLTIALRNYKIISEKNFLTIFFAIAIITTPVCFYNITTINKQIKIDEEASKKAYILEKAKEKQILVDSILKANNCNH